jgi:hypothetical protein
MAHLEIPVPFELEVFGTEAGADEWWNMGQPVLMELADKDQCHFYRWEWEVPHTMTLIHSRIIMAGGTIQHSDIEKMLPCTVFEGNRFVVVLPLTVPYVEVPTP